ncbi:Cellular retinaldehyde-binding protein [Gracilaria domingensis]|nr:Cellular retinaldehyde-binding protein [Gracilaria domingensis]
MDISNGRRDSKVLSYHDTESKGIAACQDAEEILERTDTLSTVAAQRSRSPSPTSTTITEYEFDTLDDTDPLAPPREYRRAAFQLIGETYERRQKAMAEMRDRVREYREQQVRATVNHEPITLSRYDDSTLLVFLRSSKFRIEKAASEFIGFCEAHAKHAWLRDVNVDLVGHLFSSGSYQILPKTDDDGRLILCMDMDHLMPFIEALERSRSEELLGSLFGMLETLMFDVRAQIFGVVILADLSGLKMSTFGYFTAQEYLLSLDLLQHAYPLRANAMLIVHEPWYVRGLFKFMKPFMSENAKKSLKIFGDDVGAIQSFIPGEALTKNFAGTLELEAYEHKSEWTEAVRKRFSSS